MAGNQMDRVTQKNAAMSRGKKCGERNFGHGGRSPSFASFSIPAGDD